MPSRHLLAGLIAVTTALLAGPAQAQPCEPEEVAKLVADDGWINDEFGWSVSVSEDTAVIGAYRNSDSGGASGSAYIYRLDGAIWVQEVKLLANDGETNDFFGFSVSVSGDTAVIGARGDDDNGDASGSAYVFQSDGTGWVYKAKLRAEDGAASDWFGISVSVSVSGDIAVIGAWLDDDNGIDSGSAYIFRFDGTNWIQEAKLLADDAAADDRFGNSVSVSGDTAVIGAYRDDDNDDHSGSAYVFRFDGANWVQEAKLLASDGATGDQFGWSVSISGDTAVIGADQDNDNGIESGSAYIFRFDGTGWVQEAKLLADDGAADDRFGRSVSVSGGTAVIGARLDDDNGGDSGSVYAFHFDGAGWVNETKLLAGDGSVGDRFGVSVSISNDTVVVGAHQDDVNFSGTGSAYVFDLNCIPPCLPDTNGDGMLDPTDFTAWVNAFNNQLPECDQNGDGSCTPTDFTAWIANFNAGC